MENITQWDQVVYFGFLGPKSAVKTAVTNLLNGVEISRGTSLTILKNCPGIDVKTHNKNQINVKANNVFYMNVVIVAIQVATLGIVITCGYEE